MASSSLFAVVVVALLAACATSVESTGGAGAIQPFGGSALSEPLAVGSYGSRDLLKKKRKRKTKKVTKRNVKKAKSEAINVNDEGVLINQQTNARIEGSNNTVVGGFTDEIFNLNVDTGDLDFGRKLKDTAGGNSSRDLLKKKKGKKKKRVVKKNKKNVKAAKSEAATGNVEGVAINQQTNALIEGDGNAVVGGATSEVFNFQLDTGDIGFTP